MDTDNFKKVCVIERDNKYYAVKGALRAFTSVELARERVGNPLNLTEKETSELLKNGSITVYRSSGEKENGKSLTRKEQIEKGSQRVIVVELHEGQPVIVTDSLGATTYEEIETLSIIQ